MAETQKGKTLTVKQLEHIPETIGPYRIIKYLGEGGIGLVYLAEQREPVRRKVAVKILRDSDSSSESGWRFHKERGTLARMNHHYIAQVFDAGNLADGRPYMVLEFVPGAPITQFCDENRLSPRARIECFIKVCQGIQHAHQKGIIHRDLKPNNIFVSYQDGEPIPKIIDFGIAKALESLSISLSISAETRAGVKPGTPYYMSPEQITGSSGDLDTRTDIYALGVLLFQLLSGRLPFDENTDILSYMRTATSRTPPLPSEKLAVLTNGLAPIAHARSTRPRSLIFALKGDLDWIIHKAMAPCREDRYESANELAMDLRRHLESEPLSGYTGSLTHRLIKFANRHRLSSGLVTAFLLLLLFGMAGIGWRWRAVHRAREEITRAHAQTLGESRSIRAANDFLLEALTPPMPGAEEGPGRTIRETLDEAAARAGSELAREPRAAARVYLALGEAYLWLGLPKRAIPLLESANASSVDEAFDARPALIRALIETQALDRAEALLSTLPTPLQPEMVLAKARIAQGRGDLESANQLLEDALPLILSEQPDHPLAPAYLVALARASAARGKDERAEVLLRDSLTRSQKQWGADHPQTLAARFELGALLDRQQKHGEAEPLLLKSLDAYGRFYGREHVNTRAVIEALVRCYRNLGDESIARQYESRLN